MFPGMKAHQRYLFAKRWLHTLTALVIVCVLFVHSFDTCSAHLGAFSTVFNNTAEVTKLCPDEVSDTCEVCAARHDQANSCCDASAEIAVLNSSQHAPNPQPGLINAAYFIIPAKPQLVILSGVVDSRAGPSWAVPLPLYLRSSLPVRAPPFTI